MRRLKIAYIAAGAAGMYCGNCLHDNTLAQALLRDGHEVLLIPTYTPLKTDEEDVSLNRIFFGGINVYLQQKSSLFRHTPWFLDRLLDSPALVGYLSQWSMSVRPEDLGELAVSMLEGDNGKQSKELDKLAQWLATDVKPDLVHLSNALFVGMARQLRRQLNVPVVSTVSGEDMFIDGLREPYQARARELLRERAKDVSRFVSLNHYYADVMARMLDVDRTRIQVIRHGLNLDAHAQRPARTDGPFTIGYLARIDPPKGLHFLLESFKRLAAEAGLPPLRLRVAGYLGRANRAYLAEIERHAREWGLADRFEYLGEVSRAEKIAFLQSLDCLSMPTIYPESKGLPVLEAWANGVPVVVPKHGTFPELLEDGGGLLYDPEDPQSLTEQLKRLALDPQLLAQCGADGHRVVHARHRAAQMAAQTVAWYREVLGEAPAPSPELSESTSPAEKTSPPAAG